MSCAHDSQDGKIRDIKCLNEHVKDIIQHKTILAVKLQQNDQERCSTAAVPLESRFHADFHHIINDMSKSQAQSAQAQAGAAAQRDSVRRQLQGGAPRTDGDAGTSYSANV